MGFINTHLRLEDKRNILYGMVQESKVDILGIAEAWFDEGTSQHFMSKTFGTSLHGLGKNVVIKRVVVVQVVLVCWFEMVVGKYL